MHAPLTTHHHTAVLVAIYYVTALVVLLGPYTITDRQYLTLKESINLRYTCGLVGMKTAVFAACHLALLLISALTIRYRFVAPSIVYACVSVWIAAMLYIMPSTNMPSGLIRYGELHVPKITDDIDIVCFMALGDPQEFGNNDKDRFARNSRAVDYINSYLKNEFSTVCENFRKLFLDDDRNVKFSDVMGVLVPGDLTQNGQDGRFFTSDFLGDYERKYGIGDASVLNVPVYECTGNHDWEPVTESSWWTRTLYLNNCPAVTMIKRRNRSRPNVIDADDSGNYMWRWGPLSFVALNVWPMPETDHLLAGEPKGSLKFLKRCLKKIGTNDPFVILTHYYGSDGDRYPDAFIDILGDRYRNVVGIVMGHYHPINALTYSIPLTSNPGAPIPVVNVVMAPTPANEQYEDNVACFFYDKRTRRLHLYDTRSRTFELVNRFSDTV